MKKQDMAPATSTDPADKIVITPFGPRPASQVHLVEGGYHLSYDQNGHLLKMHNATGKIARDFGPQVASRPTPKPASPVTAPDLGSGWITDARWDNFTGNPINFFTTTWVVPPAPYANNNQLLYLFNGMEDDGQGGGHILQPVLQYGSNGIWGGNSWTIDNWYASCQTCQAFYGTAVTVTPGTFVQGVMQLTGQAGGLFSYNSSFANQPVNNSLQVNNVPELDHAYETMEAYRMQYPANYPPNTYLLMSGIEIQTGGVDAGLNWTVENHIWDVGQHTVVVSNANPNGSVELFYSNNPVITGTSELGLMPSGYVQCTWSYTPININTTIVSWNVSVTNYRTGANVLRTGVNGSHLTVQPPTGTINGDQVAITIRAVLSDGTQSSASNTAVMTVH